MVTPREIVREVLDRNAAAVIFAHNHPSRLAYPSDADREITRKLRGALGLTDVDVLDHVIVGGSECYSFAENGSLSRDDETGLTGRSASAVFE